MQDKQKMQNELINKANEILNKTPLNPSELAFFDIAVIMELDEMANKNNPQAIELKTKIATIIKGLKNTK
jgi:hypothetical protein